MASPSNSTNKFGPSSYVVGTVLGNGCNFTSIQSAITQAVADGFTAANPCTILVRPGSYSGFTMAPGILVEGVAAGSVFSNNAVVSGTVTIDSTTAGGVQYALKNLTITDPADALVIQGVGPTIVVDVANCSLQGNRGVVVSNTSGTLSQFAFRECRIVGTLIAADFLEHNSIFIINSQLQGGTVVVMSGDARLRAFNSIFDASVDYGVSITGTGNRMRMEFCNISCPQEAVLGVNNGELVDLEHCSVDSSAVSGNYIDNVSTFEFYDLALMGTALVNNAILTNFVDWQPHAGTAANATLPGGVRGTACFDSTQFAVSDGFVNLTGNNSSLPMFSAYKSANTLNATGNGTTVTVVFDTEIFDQGGVYDNATGTFTAPSDGRYFFEATIAALNIGAAHTSGTAFFLAAGTTYVGQSQNAGAMRELTSNSLNWLCHDVIDLIAGQTVVVRFVVSNSTLTVTLAGNAPPLITTRFAAWKIG
jgi:hypothetical protein